MIALLLAATLALPAPDTPVRLPRGTTVEISTFDRPVRLNGVAGDRVTVRGTGLELDGRTLEIDGGMPGRSGRGPVTIDVPTWATVRIETVSGEVVITEAPTDLQVDAVDGRIAVRGGGGEMSLSGTGAIEVTDFRGSRLGIEGLTGSIRVAGATGSLEIESVNGQIGLERVTSRDVQVSTTNGQVSWAGPLDPAGTYRFETHNGNIVLRLPPRVSARLRVETFNGSFDTRIPAATTGAAERRPGPPRERRVTATYGRGEATVELSSFNGSVVVRPLGET